MPFANVENKNKTFLTKKIPYMNLSTGLHIIRILDENAIRFDTHWVDRGSVQCLGDDCPICQNNIKIYTEHPKDFRNVKGWNPTRKLFFVNIYDRTPVKICPNCGTENYKDGNNFLPACSECGSFITNVKEAPLNKIKVLSKGAELFSEFNSLEETELDADGNPIPLTSYDIVLKVTGVGKERKILPVIRPNQNDVLDIKKEDLFDLSSAVIKLTAEEIIKLLQGVSLKDIFAARKANEESKENSAIEEVGEEIKDDVQKRLAQLFN